MADTGFRKILPFLKGESGEQRLVRFWSKIGMGGVDECWEWKASTDTSGYGRFKIASYLQCRAHRVALIASQMREPEGKLALHHCDNRKCCNPHHLYFGTVQDNANDKVARGRCYSGDQSGVKNGAAKINEEQLEVIVRRLASGWNNKQIAADMPIGHAMVSKIRLGHLWAEQTAVLGWKPKESKLPHKRRSA